MANLTLKEAYIRASTANTLYNRNRQRWQFYLDSYSGGLDYRNGQYLHRYQLESPAEYNSRLANTPLDNQCKSIISLYISFLFREAPVRDLGTMQNLQVSSDILEDADLDGRSMDAFMKDVAIWTGVFGHVWCCVAKPSSNAETLAAEIQQGIRPYLSVHSPLTVTDWRWEQKPNGGYELGMIKLVEEINDSLNVVKEWTRTEIITTVIDIKKSEAVETYTEPNNLGRLPWVCVYAERTPVRGVGMSMISDIADQQRMIYNELAEVYDSIRLDTHPSLVATAETNVSGAAAGQVITMPENMDPALKPFVLQFEGGQTDKIYASIQNRKQMIDGMANVGSVRVNETREMSGRAMEVEMTLLNARLCSIADNLELAEEQIWQEIAAYLGTEWTGTVRYPEDFSIRNVENELDQLAKMKSLSTLPELQTEIDMRIADILEIDISTVAEAELDEDLRTYPDGETIPAALPEAYQPDSSTEVPIGQNCANCAAYNPDTKQCSVWANVVVRPNYWCAKWVPQG
jgi:hypothetical protein